MHSKPTQPIPQPTIRRLPAYLRLLRQLRQEGVKTVSCTRIAQELDLDCTLVRKDLSITGITGRPRVGYQLQTLIDFIRNFLGWDRPTSAFLVGVGGLGRALIGYEHFVHCGLEIVAAFDCQEMKIGQRVFGRSIYDLSDMARLVTSMEVSVGILTVPISAAQEVATVMVRSGIVGIWNFVPIKLDVPDHILVENVELGSSLAMLSINLQTRHSPVQTTDSRRLAKRPQWTSL